jgi:hypothetical protein
MSGAMIVATEPRGGAVTPAEFGGFDRRDDDMEPLFRPALAFEKRLTFASELSHLSAPGVGRIDNGREVKTVDELLRLLD